MKTRLLRVLSQPLYPVLGLCVVLILLLIPYRFGLIPPYVVIASALLPLLVLMASFIWGFNYNIKES